MAVRSADEVHLGLTGRSLTREHDLTVDQWRALLDLAAELKRARHDHVERPRLRGMSLALVFARPSTRTRCAFEIAAHDLGARAVTLDPDNSHLGHRESVPDTARVLGRLVDGVAYRGFHHGALEQMALHCGVPVWNAATDRWDPLASLADVLTVRERTDKPLGSVVLACVGDARTAAARSLLVAGAMSGLEVRMVTPPGLEPPADAWAVASTLAETTGARLVRAHEPDLGVRGADVVHAAAWTTAGEPAEGWPARLRLLRPYRVDAELLRSVGSSRVTVLHRQPAVHDLQTEEGSRVLAAVPGERCLEVTDEVLGSAASALADQAENRLHAVKAVMVATLDPRRRR